MWPATLPSQAEANHCKMVAQLENLPHASCATQMSDVSSSLVSEMTAADANNQLLSTVLANVMALRHDSCS